MPTEPIVVGVDNLIDPPLHIDETPITIRRWRSALYGLLAQHGMGVGMTIHKVDLPGATVQLYAYSWSIYCADERAPTRDEHHTLHQCMLEIEHLRPAVLTVSPKLADLIKAERTELDG